MQVRLGVEAEPELVLDDRPGDGRVDDVEVGRRRGVGRVAEEAQPVAVGRAVELELELVRARLGHEVDGAARGHRVVGAVAAGLDLERRRRVQRRELPAHVEAVLGEDGLVRGAAAHAPVDAAGDVVDHLLVDVVAAAVGQVRHQVEVEVSLMFDLVVTDQSAASPRPSTSSTAALHLHDDVHLGRRADARRATPSGTTVSSLGAVARSSKAPGMSAEKRKAPSSLL